MDNIDKRKYMEQVIEVMRGSIHEKRVDAKPSPNVGALIVKPDGSVETAYRGELREGDHAEYTLLERKCRDEKLDGSILFATLEPCAPGARHFPKLSCAERIVNARIAKVFIGIEDPDPTVCGKGRDFLLENGVDVEFFPRDLQRVIEECNLDFLSAANERNRLAGEAPVLEASDNLLEMPVPNASLRLLDSALIQKFIDKAGWGLQFGEDDCMELLCQLRLLVLKDTDYIPTGAGLLLFGKHPEVTYPNAVIKATFIDENGGEDILDIRGPLVNQPDLARDWYKTKIPSHIDRSNPKRKTVYDYPLTVIREMLMNAIVHRRYDLTGAPVYLTIDKNNIVIKSPGEPVKPLTMEQMNNFSAPAVSRNPSIMFVFSVLDLSEQRGFGFNTVRELPDVWNLPLPSATWDNPYLVYTLPRASGSQRVVTGLNEKEQKAYDFIRANEVVSRKQLENYLSVEERSAERILSSLMSKGFVIKVGKGKNTQYSVSIPDKIPDNVSGM